MLYASLPGPGLPVFTFFCTHIVNVAAFARVHIRLCSVACILPISILMSTHSDVYTVYMFTLACVYIHWCLLSMVLLVIGLIMYAQIIRTQFCYPHCGYFKIFAGWIHSPPLCQPVWPHICCVCTAGAWCRPKCDWQSECPNI